MTQSDSKKRTSSTSWKLTSRLVSHNSFTSALEELQSELDRYTVVIRRSLFSTEVAESDLPTIVFHEEEPLVKDEEIDARILSSKEVFMVATTKDGGVAVINFTSRHVSPFYMSPQMIRVIRSFNSRLVETARSRWITAGAIAALILVPPLAMFGLVLADQAVNPRVSAAMSANNPATPIHFDPWVGQAAAEIAVLWIPLLAIALIFGFIRRWSGPLRIWPDKMTRKSLVLTRDRLRMSDSVRKNSLTIMVAVITAVIAAVIARLL
jgi:hypothetical protein